MLMHLVHSSSVDSRMSWKSGARYAALLHRMSMRPFRAAAAATARATSAVKDTSAWQNSAAPPFSRMPCTAALPASSSISDTSTQAPSSAHSSLMALPIPLAPPVTMTTLSFSLFMNTPVALRACSASAGRFFRAAKDSVRSLDHVTRQLFDVFFANLAHRSRNSQPRHEFARLIENRSRHAAHFELLFFIVDGVSPLPDLHQFLSQKIRRRDGSVGVMRE